MWSSVESGTKFINFILKRVNLFSLDSTPLDRA